MLIKSNVKKPKNAGDVEGYGISQTWTLTVTSSVSIPLYQIINCIVGYEYSSKTCCKDCIKLGKMGFQPRWRHRQILFASSHNQKKDNNQLKNKKQPELPENLTVWKSEELKKKHSSRVVGGAEMGSQGKEDVWPWWQLVDQAVPHSPTDKAGGTTGERDRPRDPGLQCKKIKASKPWGLGQWEKLSVSQESLEDSHR